MGENAVVARVFTVFRSRLRDDITDEYGELASELEDMARQSPGFVDYTSLTAQDGEHVSIVVFETPEAQAAWRNNLDHRHAQQRGRDRFYEWYEVSVCQEMRTTRWSGTRGNATPGTE